MDTNAFPTAGGGLMNQQEGQPNQAFPGQQVPLHQGYGQPQQPYQPPHQGFNPATQQEEHGHMYPAMETSDVPHEEQHEPHLSERLSLAAGSPMSHMLPETRGRGESLYTSSSGVDRWDYVVSFVNTDVPEGLSKPQRKFFKKQGLIDKHEDEVEENKKRFNEDRIAVLSRLHATGLGISKRTVSTNGHFINYKLSISRFMMRGWAEYIGLEKELTNDAIMTRLNERKEELTKETGGLIEARVNLSHIPRFEDYTAEMADITLESGNSFFIQTDEGEFTSGERNRVLVNILTGRVQLNIHGELLRFSGLGMDHETGIMVDRWTSPVLVETKDVGDLERFNGYKCPKSGKDAVHSDRPVFADIFPLHEEKMKAFLMKEWVHGLLRFPWKNSHPDLAGKWTWEQPLDEIRNYLGEKIALYFAWLGFYTTWLWVPSFFGFVLFIWQRSNKDGSDNVGVVLYCIFIALWGTLFLEFWKRYNSALAWEWNVMDFEEEERPRARFRGKEMPNAITGEIEKYYPRAFRWLTYMISIPTVLTLIAVVIITTLSLFLLRFWFKQWHFGLWGSFLGGFGQGFLILFMNIIFKKLGEKLNGLENHRTQTEYEDSLIAKTFMFQFINSYFSLFYVAFWKSNASLLDGSQDECKHGSCMNELTIQLAVVFSVQVLVGQFKEALIPLIKACIGRAKFGGKGADDHEEDDALTSRKVIAAQALLPIYDTNKDVMGDYNEMIIQFGYVTMFAAAFPLASFIALANNVLEIRMDAAKILKMYKRPHYKGAEDIGTWFVILEIMTWVSIITNCLLLGFTSTVLPSWGINSNFALLYTVMIAEHILFFIKVLLKGLIPDVPARVRDELLREQFQEKQVVRRLARNKGEIAVPAESMLSGSWNPNDDTSNPASRPFSQESNHNNNNNNNHNQHPGAGPSVPPAGDNGTPLQDMGHLHSSWSVSAHT